MRVLGVETVTSVISVAIVDEEKVLGELSMDVGLTHSTYLMANIETILKAVNLKVEDLDGFAVSAGPGSFTGLRVGVAVANAIGWALGIPVNGKNIQKGESTDIGYT